MRSNCTLASRAASACDSCEPAEDCRCIGWRAWFEAEAEVEAEDPRAALALGRLLGLGFGVPHTEQLRLPAAFTRVQAAHCQLPLLALALALALRLLRPLALLLLLLPAAAVPGFLSLRATPPWTLLAVCTMHAGKSVTHERSKRLRRRSTHQGGEIYFKRSAFNLDNASISPHLLVFSQHSACCAV